MVYLATMLKLLNELNQCPFTLGLRTEEAIKYISKVPVQEHNRGTERSLALDPSSRSPYT